MEQNRWRIDMICYVSKSRNKTANFQCCFVEIIESCILIQEFRGKITPFKLIEEDTQQQRMQDSQETVWPNRVYNSTRDCSSFALRDRDSGIPALKNWKSGTGQCPVRRLLSATWGPCQQLVQDRLLNIRSFWWWRRTPNRVCRFRLVFLFLIFVNFRTKFWFLTSSS